jgi:uncharacterized membrane protein YfcA
VLRLVAIGVVAGVVSALFGVGGGLVIVPLLILVAAFGAHEATATSLGAIGLTALAGVVLYALRGHVDVGYAALVGLPAVVGVFAGTALQQRLTNRALTAGFAVLVAGIGTWFLVS